MFTTRSIAVATCLLSLAAAGCGLDPKKIAAHEVYAKDGDTVELKRDTVRFAVIGATRSALYGTRAEPTVPAEIIADVRTQVAVKGIDFVVLTGGYVRRSTTGEWKDFGERWVDVLRSEQVSQNKGRVPAQPMPGPGELMGDPRYRGIGAAFPDSGVPIGFNRTATWGAFDIQVNGATWRLLFVDTHRRTMQSRWEEQLFWLPKAVQGDYDKLIAFMPDPRVTLAKGASMDDQDAPTELIQVIEDHTDVLKLTAVFSGGPGTNELYMPSGAYGEAYVVAGNAGIGMPDLMRWGPADAAGYKDLGLDGGFDLALQRQLDVAAAAEAVPARVVDMAKARNSYEGFTAGYDGSAFPIQGWWVVELGDDEMALTFRSRAHDGSMSDAYTTRFTKAEGWTPVP